MTRVPYATFGLANRSIWAFARLPTRSMKRSIPATGGCAESWDSRRKTTKRWFSWTGHEATRYCEWLSQKEGRSYRLPTEAEWEYACRAGTVTPFSEGNTLGQAYLERAGESWYPDPKRKGDAWVFPVRVKQISANAWGLFDMHGNVEEWCRDWYGPYDASDLNDPVGRATGTFRVTRGGSHSTEIYYLRSSNRAAAVPEDKHWLIGFRVVLGPLPETKPLPAPGPELHQKNVGQTVPARLERGPDPTQPYFSGPRRFVDIPGDAFGPMFANHNHVPALSSVRMATCWPRGIRAFENVAGELGAVASRLRYGQEDWEPAAPFWDVPDRNDHATALWYDGGGTLFPL